jgi:RNA-directed DNA polymerase
MAATGSDGILAYNLTSNLCGVRTDQFTATTRTYDLNATSRNRPHYATNGLEHICCGKSARRVLTGGTSPRSHAGSVRSPVRKRRLRQGSAKATASRLVSTGHTIPHFELLKSVARRVSDRHMLHLIQMWLEAPVEETDQRRHKKRTTRNRDEKRGIPQGSPLSPLLSNIYMRRFVLGWKQLGYAARYKAHIVNYADDLVICCKGNVEEALRAMRQVMDRLRLTVNEEKTHLCHLPEQYFDFLGYTFGRCYSPQTGRAYLGTRPSKKSIQSQIESIREKTDRKRCGLAAEVVVKELNAGLRGWANYFKLGPVGKAHRAIDAYATQRLRRWLRGKHKVSGSGYTRYPDEYLYQQLGLVRLPQLARNLPWATA